MGRPPPDRYACPGPAACEWPALLGHVVPAYGPRDRTEVVQTLLHVLPPARLAKRH